MNNLKWILPVLTMGLLISLVWPDSSDPPARAVEGADLAINPQAMSLDQRTVGNGMSQSVSGHLTKDGSTEILAIELPESLRGTEVDGGFRVDEQGNLIVELGIKRYFDYFMATVGEESLADITARIQSAISTQLQEPAKSQALTILQDYLSYKTALYELEQQFGEFNPASFDEAQLPLLARRLEAIMGARRVHLASDVVEAFFKEDEVVDVYTMEKLTIMHNSSLSKDEKNRQIALLESQLPESVRQQRSETTQYQNYATEEAKLRNRNASPAEIHQLRVQTYGEDGAVRLAELDERRVVWGQRLGQYRLEKKQLERAGLSPQDLNMQLGELREQHFSPIELRRVKALDRIDEQ